MIEHGPEYLNIRLPAHTDIFRLKPEAPLAAPAQAILHALAAPIGAPPLAEVVRAHRRVRKDMKAVIVVSDTTRPVPYRGDAGILEPVLDVLEREGVRAIDILVATGTHRPLADAELRRMLPDRVFHAPIGVFNHVCTDNASLRCLGRTPRGTEASVNARYLDADLKILTGLVEPHFMAGASGGPKSICPGLVGEGATYVFHGAALMADPHATSLLLEGNPCQAESLAVAEMAGVDFIVNVTLNNERKLTGVYAGALRQAHGKAVAHLMMAAGISIQREYDLVVTHAGFVGINHYQAAKAAVEASKAVRPGGRIVLSANHTDVDPVGGPNYRRVLPLLQELGVDGFHRRITDAAWQFIPEQWEVQMWARAIGKLGAYENLVYCAPALTGELFIRRQIPGQDGGAGITGLTGRALAEVMVQRAIDNTLAAAPDARLAVLLDGPYGVPMLRSL